MKYLIVECEELSDQFECDADRTPLCVVDDYSCYNKMGYEIYQIQPDGKLTKIRDYDQVTDEYIAYCEYDEDEKLKCAEQLMKGDRDSVNLSMVKKWKKAFNFTDTIDEIYKEICRTGAHGETLNGVWCVIGEAYDGHYPLGY